MKKTLCLRCKKEFFYDEWVELGRYCSKECKKYPSRSKGPMFLWAKATEEEKIQRLKDSLYKNVIQNEIGCWGWNASKYSNGYGKMGTTVNGHRPLPHRISYLLHNGPIPPEMCVLHTCDNRECCRPDHLFLGTKSDNSKDMHAKLRGMHGDSHPNAVLNVEIVKEIKKLLKSGMPNCDISRKLGVSQANIGGIKRGHTWRHVTIDEKESNDNKE